MPTSVGLSVILNSFPPTIASFLGLRISDNLKKYTSVPDALKPIVFITHMEHHSNQTSWLETIADVEIIPHTNAGLVCLKSFDVLLKKYENRAIKIASVTACSNVTGIQPDVYEIAKIIHSNNGLCFVDFACSAPYVNIDMHFDDVSYFDAIFFSPHKFMTIQRFMH